MTKPDFVCFARYPSQISCLPNSRTRHNCIGLLEQQNDKLNLQLLNAV